MVGIAELEGDREGGSGDLDSEVVSGLVVELVLEVEPHHLAVCSSLAFIVAVIAFVYQTNG